MLDPEFKIILLKGVIMQNDFQRISDNPFKYRDKCDFFSISKDKNIASLKYSTEKHIQNAWVFVGCEGDIQEWRVENGRPSKVPKPLEVCLKGTKTVWICIGNPDDEESYYKLHCKNEDEVSDIEKLRNYIIGIVEACDCTVAFYYDIAGDQGWYGNYPRAIREGTLFMVIQEMLNVGRKKFDNGRTI